MRVRAGRRVARQLQLGSVAAAGTFVAILLSSLWQDRPNLDREWPLYVGSIVFWSALAYLFARMAGDRKSTTGRSNTDRES